MKKSFALALLAAAALTSTGYAIQADAPCAYLTQSTDHHWKGMESDASCEYDATIDQVQNPALIDFQFHLKNGRNKPGTTGNCSGQIDGNLYGDAQTCQTFAGKDIFKDSSGGIITEGTLDHSTHQLTLLQKAGDTMKIIAEPVQ